jgi:predicted secreted hydrolase
LYWGKTLLDSVDQDEPALASKGCKEVDMNPNSLPLRLLACVGLLLTVAPGCDSTDLAEVASAKVCEAGERMCDPEGKPMLCEEGRWVAHGPCGRWSFCNHGVCQESMVDLPADESPHASLVEWWYFTGHLFDADRNIYGFELTFFLFSNILRLPVWMIHTGLVNESTKQHEMQSLFETGPPEGAPGELDLSVAGQKIVRKGSDVFLLSGTTGPSAFELTLTNTKRPCYHGGNGLIRMSSLTDSSFYYSRTRLEVEGSLFTDGRDIPVAGQAWMDHQWGNFLPFVLAGWDWFSIQLADGYEIMLFIFRRDNDGNPSSIDFATGSIMDPHGNQVPILYGDFTVTPLDSWVSHATGGAYPQNWEIEIPKHEIHLTLTTNVPDQEMPNPVWNYWEGRVDVSGTRGDAEVQGMGFVELTGYAGRPVFAANSEE